MQKKEIVMKEDKILETSSSSGIQDKLFTKTSWTPVEIESIESNQKGICQEIRL